jgi:hypothetical protein
VTADEALGIASSLVALARALPPDVVAHHGTPPTQDIPFRS